MFGDSDARLLGTPAKEKGGERRGDARTLHRLGGTPVRYEKTENSRDQDRSLRLDR